MHEKLGFVDTFKTGAELETTRSAQVGGLALLALTTVGAVVVVKKTFQVITKVISLNK